MINQFSLRPDSGGKGKFNGGNGLIREMYFRETLNLCILTERRVFSPCNLNFLIIILIILFKKNYKY
jgi:5-oxoprolinase (ATP-hydrolysing)